MAVLSNDESDLATLKSTGISKLPKFLCQSFSADTISVTATHAGHGGELQSACSFGSACRKQKSGEHALGPSVEPKKGTEHRTLGSGQATCETKSPSNRNEVRAMAWRSSPSSSSSSSRLSRSFQSAGVFAAQSSFFQRATQDTGELPLDLTVVIHP